MVDKTKEEFAKYVILSDAYKTRFRGKYKTLESTIKHMVDHIGIDSTIYLLIETMRNNKEE